MRIDKYSKEITLKFNEAAIVIVVFILPIIGMFISQFFGE